MLKRKVAFNDFDGNRGEETVYFNLTEPELFRLDVEFNGGLEKFINQLDPEQRPQEVLDLFEKVIRMSYGEKSEDGRHFIKSKEKTDLFMQSAVYGALFMEIVGDAEVAAAFFNALISKTAIG